MSAGTFVPVHLNSEVLERMGLPDLPFPVEQERVEEIFQGDSVRFDLILEELDRFVIANPDLASEYRPALVSLSHVLAVREGAAGRPEKAIELLEIALRHAPSSPRLHANLGLGLQLSGRPKKALAHYRQCIMTEEDDSFPLVRVLAARACSETGDHEDAYRLLDSCRDDLGTEESFARLISDYGSRARGGVAEATPRPKVANFCRACGASLRKSSRFCTACGESVVT